MSEEEVEEEEYKVQANLLKDDGNAAFQAGDIETAIKLFSDAIAIDPDNKVYYSNRSAAYMKVDSISKALHDAEKCVELDPLWAKGYNRLGVAQQRLKRFDAACDTFKKGIELDPDNGALWSAFRACQDAHEADKKQRFASAAIERDLEEKKLQARNKLKQEIQAEKERKAKEDAEEDLLMGFLSEVVPEPKSEPPVSAEADDDLLAGFFNEIITPAQPTGPVPADVAEVSKQAELTEKYTNQDLGDGRSQFERIMGRHHEWKNLNPFYVLQLGIDATEEDIKLRYKKLSLKVHPDRLRDIPNARDAFEQVKDAYTKLCDEVQKKTVVLHAESVIDEVKKERRKAVARGIPEGEQEDYEQHLNRELMKHFAEIERMRQRSESNLRSYSARDKMQEAEEQEKIAKYAEFDKNWTEDNRRDKRIGNWRDFQTEPEAKKAKGASFKEEHRTETKHGVVKTETWKKSWK